MAATEKLGMQLIEGSDVVDPSVINDNFKKVDGLAVDYVVESGMSGEWWYRKWNSGRYECGVDRKAFDNVQTGTPITDVFFSRRLTFDSFPINFVSPPLSIIQFIEASAGNEQHVIWTVNTGDATNNRPPNFAVATAIAVNLGTCYIGCYTTGRWK